MVTKQFSLLFIFFFLSSCAVKTISDRNQPPKKNTIFNDSDFKEPPPPPQGTNGMPATPTAEIKNEIQVPSSDMTTKPQPTSPTVTSQSAPRIGLIFTGGGAKAWAHVGVLKEIEKAKWPINGVAGIEWGATVAAIYAHQLSSNEAEWEMLKVKNLNELDTASETIFANRSVAELKIPFVCPSLNVAQQQIYLLNRGQLAQLLPFCLAQPPLSGAFKQSVAAMSDLAALAQHLRATGIKKVVLINVLAQQQKRSFVPDYLSAENILWVQAAAVAERRVQGIDDVIQINLDDYGIKDLDHKREIIARGAELSYNQIKKISQKYGL